MSSAAAATNSPPPAPICPQRRRPTPLLPKPLSNQIPIDRQPLTSPRGFLLRRLSDAGPRHGCTGRSRAGIRNPSRKTTFGSPDDNGSIEPQQRFVPPLQKRPFALVPARAPGRKSVGVRMAPRGSSKLSRNAKKPIQSGASVGRRPRSRVVFTRGDGLVEQRSDFFANDVARPTGFAPSVAHFRRRCSKEFPFQGVKQRR